MARNHFSRADGGNIYIWPAMNRLWVHNAEIHFGGSAHLFAPYTYEETKMKFKNFVSHRLFFAEYRIGIIDVSVCGAAEAKTNQFDSQ